MAGIRRVLRAFIVNFLVLASFETWFVSWFWKVVLVVRVPFLPVHTLSGQPPDKPEKDFGGKPKNRRFPSCGRRMIASTCQQCYDAKKFVLPYRSASHPARSH